MDDDGYVRIVGRIRDIVIRGGENIYPREIEEFLYTPSGNLRRAGDRRADERYGEQLMAWIVSRTASTLSAEDVREFAAADRPLQDSALHQVRRRVPPHGHRQDPEVQDARARD